MEKVLIEMVPNCGILPLAVTGNHGEVDCPLPQEVVLPEMVSI
jgi:hypothetical protein